MFRKIKTEKIKVANLLSAQESLDIVLGEEDEINHVIEVHGVDSVETLICSFPATAYDENVIETYYEDNMPLDEDTKNKEIMAFYKKRKRDLEDALDDFKQSDIYESMISVQELITKYEKLVK